jgi:hypothetical protein
VRVDPGSGWDRRGRLVAERNTEEAMNMNTPIQRTRRPITAGLAVAVAIGMLAAGPTAFAASPATVGLGTAGSFGVLAGTTVTNTGATTINGNLGVSPGSAITGAPTVSGTIHAADAVALQAQNDLTTAYVDAAGRPVTNTYTELAGLTLVAGVYGVSAATSNLTGTLTLDGQGDPNSVWIFKATSTFITSSSSRVALINGASPCNVFWQVTSSATLATGSTLAGTIMALTSITITSGATVNGRALARTGAVTLDNNTISGSSCSSPVAVSPSPSASASPSTSPSASPSPTASPSPSATSTPTATVAPIATTAPTVPPTATSNPITAAPSGTGLPVLFGLVFLAALSLMAASRRYRTVHIPR